MFRFLCICVTLASLTAAAAEGPEEAYQSARKGYFALKADEKRRRFRHNWQNVAKRFDAVAQRYPKSDRAPDALFTAGQLFEDLSQISRLPEDLDAATGDYQKLLDGYPNHRLCDDAALQLARISLDRTDKPERARQVATDALARFPKGDRAKELRALLGSLPPAPRAASPKGVEAKAMVKAAEPSVEPAVSPVVAAIAELQRLPAPAAQAVTDPEPKALRAEVPSKNDARRAFSTDLVAEPEVKPGEPEPPAKDAKARLKGMSGSGGEMTLAQQLGLKVRRVVIDAGHGGHDTGAVGPTGTREKDVTLAIAHRLANLLTAGGLDVRLTRDDDTFVRLEDRARLANEDKGDLFISIHCNSAPTPEYRGVETYTLNTSADRYAIRLAARENSSSEKGISDLQFILADLATKANTDESQRLANRVQHSLIGELKGKYKNIHDHGTKEALFYVLLGAKMPAILVETSFLSNPEEEKRLSSASYQEDVAQAVAQGVNEFLQHREQLAKVP